MQNQLLEPKRYQGGTKHEVLQGPEEAEETGEALKAQVAGLTAQLQQSEEALKSAQERYIRLNADFDNFRKRSVSSRDVPGQCCLELSWSDCMLLTWNERMHAIVTHRPSACFALVSMREGRWQGLHCWSELCWRTEHRGGPAGGQGRGIPAQAAAGGWLMTVHCPWVSL